MAQKIQKRNQTLANRRARTQTKTFMGKNDRKSTSTRNTMDRQNKRGDRESMGLWMDRHGRIRKRKVD